MEPYNRKLTYLKHIKSACESCTMCNLGFKPMIKNAKEYNQHVFSNMNPKRFMVVGQNPGANEVIEKEPFVGNAGQIFNKEIKKHGIIRDDFYITNTVKCYTEGNTKPDHKTVSRCEPYLKIEINIIKPVLVITLGSVAFNQFCPDFNYTESMGSVIESDLYNVNVFPIYHPSPLNLSQPSRKRMFQKQVKLLCKVMVGVK